MVSSSLCITLSICLPCVLKELIDFLGTDVIIMPLETTHLYTL